MAGGDFSGRLLGGERILWTGRPGQGVRLSGRDALLIPFGLMWCGFIVLWYSISLHNNLVFPLLWGVPFAAIGLYLVIGRFLVDAWARSVTWYALTSRRVLIEMDGLASRFTALSLDRLPDMQLSEHADGSGTILFGQPAPYRSQSWTYYTPALDPTPQFIAIADARAVFDQIQRASRGAA